MATIAFIDMAHWTKEIRNTPLIAVGLHLFHLKLVQDLFNLRIAYDTKQIHLIPPLGSH